MAKFHSTKNPAVKLTSPENPPFEMGRQGDKFLPEGIGTDRGSEPSTWAPDCNITVSEKGTRYGRGGKKK